MATEVVSDDTDDGAARVSKCFRNAPLPGAATTKTTCTRLQHISYLFKNHGNFNYNSIIPPSLSTNT